MRDHHAYVSDHYYYANVKRELRGLAGYVFIANEPNGATRYEERVRVGVGVWVEWCVVRVPFPYKTSISQVDP